MLALGLVLPGLGSGSVECSPSFALQLPQCCMGAAAGQLSVLLWQQLLHLYLHLHLHLHQFQLQLQHHHHHQQPAMWQSRHIPCSSSSSSNRQGSTASKPL